MYEAHAFGYHLSVLDECEPDPGIFLDIRGPSFSATIEMSCGPGIVENNWTKKQLTAHKQAQHQLSRGQLALM